MTHPEEEQGMPLGWYVPEGYRQFETSLTGHSESAVHSLQGVLQKRLIDSHLTGELYITQKEIENINTLFARWNEMCGNFLNLLDISELFVLVYDKDDRLVASSKSYLRTMWDTREDINDLNRAGISYKEAVYNQDVVPLEYMRVTWALIEADQGAGYQFKEFEALTRWIDPDKWEDDTKLWENNIRLKVLWTTFPAATGGTIRIGIPEYLLPGKNPVPPHERWVMKSEQQSEKMQKLWTRDLLEWAQFFPNLHSKSHMLQAKVSQAVQSGLYTDITRKEFADIVEGIWAIKNISQNLDALNNQLAFWIARYNLNGRPTFWSKWMEHHLGYNLAQLHFYLDDWKSFFFWPEGDELRIKTEEIAAANQDCDSPDEVFLPTSYGYPISLEEYRIHQASEKAPSLMNLFYAYSKDTLQWVIDCVSQLQPGEGYSEVLFNPRWAKGFPVSTMWTSLGLKHKWQSAGNIRFMRPAVVRDEDERSFDKKWEEL